MKMARNGTCRYTYGNLGQFMHDVGVIDFPGVDYAHVEMTLEEWIQDYLPEPYVNLLLHVNEHGFITRIQHTNSDQDEYEEWLWEQEYA